MIHLIKNLTKSCSFRYKRRDLHDTKKNNSCLFYKGKEIPTTWSSAKKVIVLLYLLSFAKRSLKSDYCLSLTQDSNLSQVSHSNC